MVAITLQAHLRDVTGHKVKRLRQKGEVPGVVYGRGRDAEPISIDLPSFKKAYGQAGSGTLVDLSIDDKDPVKVLIHEPQAHHLSGEPIHVDFYAVKMDEEIETAIPVHFVGIAPAVEELEGNFIANKDELTIRCLPANLIPNVEIDISTLKTFEDQIRVSDITVPETVQVLDDAEEVIALVTAPRSEEELEAELAEDKAAEEAAVAELGEAPAAAEGEEGAEAEAPADGEKPADAPTADKAE